MLEVDVMHVMQISRRCMSVIGGVSFQSLMPGAEAAAHIASPRQCLHTRRLLQHIEELKRSEVRLTRQTGKQEALAEYRTDIQTESKMCSVVVGCATYVANRELTPH